MYVQIGTAQMCTLSSETFVSKSLIFFKIAYALSVISSEFLIAGSLSETSLSKVQLVK